ncbi:MAG TPA: MoxR family ATPase [Planctomycetota bacterium]|nr:MoxR family ATPase [Planctomycetota bacterium]
MSNENWTDADQAKIEHLKKAHDDIVEQLRKAVVGQDAVVRLTMLGLFSQGHCLLMGVPGLGKTLLVRTIAACLSLKFKRVQFTPDLMPSDITGTEVIQENKATGERHFRFLEGPIFTNILLADEINRTPPKTQAALLEAMQERQVTVGGQRRDLDAPFFVLATQNPIEQEGTYPLPEAQLDRFMFQINVGYPSEEEELKILDMTTSGYKSDVKAVLSQIEILDLQQIVRKVRISEPITRYILRLVRTSRSGEKDAPEFIKKWVTWGASPRASQNLVLGAKAAAILDGRSEVKSSDVREVAHAVLGHRILPNFAAEAEGVTRHRIVDELLKSVRE